MIRYLLFIMLAMFASEATAQTEHSIVGANPPAQYSVCAGDTLVLRKPMGRDLLKDGSRASYATAWNDRARSNSAGNEFETVGATKLAAVGFVAGKGYIYAPVDAKPCASAGPLFGANLSGAESKGGDAVRPSLSDFKGYVERYGFQLIRYPFKDNRMTASRIAELKTNVEYLISMNVPVILDNHTYVWNTPQGFVNFWAPFIANFPKSDLVMIDLVNEPKGFNDPVLTNDFDQWARDSNLTIAGLRAAGVTNPILLEWPGYSATFRFDKKEPANKPCASAGCAIDRAGGLVDPLNKLYMNGHRYFDTGSQGFSPSCVDQVSGFATFAANLRKRGLQGYITESAFGSSYGVKASCAAVGEEAFAALKANADVIKGITWWGGGRVWPESYAFKIEPAKATRFTAPVPAYTKRLTGK